MRAFTLALIVAITCTSRAATAQGVTGQVGGLVVDGSGSLVPGAAVTIVNTGTNSKRHTVTAADGAFVFVDLLAGTYDLTVALEGFKTVEQKGIPVTSTERVTIPTFVLEVGGTRETVTVRGDVPLVQTATSARQALVTREQIDTIALKGRDVLGTLSLLPGVVDTNPREAPSWNLLSGLSINGRGSFNLTYDGVNNKETESNLGNLASPALDSIAEVRVQTSNFQAEYGRSSGASITLITRSGSKDFRGSAAFYKRDTALNGNEFLRKQQCRQGDNDFCKQALYRFDNYAWTLGGPVLVPGTGFNSGRNRLFFFWSQDILERTDPGALIQRRMPTAKERIGDFSQTFDTAGNLINIRDPQLSGACNATGPRGPACFPDNIVPADRIDPTGQAILNLLPLPNLSDPTGKNPYNYTYQMVNDWPRNDQVLRLDWNAGPRTTVYGRVQFGYENRSGLSAPFGFTGFFPRMASKFETEAISYVNTLLHTISPTTFLEATAGVNWQWQHASPLDQAALDANTRGLVLPGFPAFLPEGNPLDLLPNASFASSPGIVAAYAPIIMYERRFPFSGYMTLWNLSSSVTKIHGPHNIKTGIFVEHAARPVPRRSAFNGTLSFASEGSNPFNTNMGYANAMLGTVASYQKADTRPLGDAQFVITEFYAQDNWRARRGLTLDTGVRFHYMTPTRSDGDQVAQFEPERFDIAAAPLLYQPVSTPQGRRALNPLSGEIWTAGYIGRLVSKSGETFTGMQLYDGTPHRRSPFRVAPRVGFAWNVTGDGRSAVRGGFGVFYDRYADNDILELLEVAPLVRTYTVSQTRMVDLVNTPPTETPSAVRRFVEFVPPVVYNWSLGAQREVGWNVVGDVAYVGNAARHQPISRELNGRPYGYTYQASSLDQTNVSNGQAQPLPDDLLRPYRGYSSILQREFTGYAEYHSLQAMVTRRQSKDGFSGGAAYTYQIVNKSLGAIDPFLADNRARHYNSAGRRPHVLTLHYSYRVPNPPASLPSPLKAILDGWQVSGVTSMLSGAQGGFAYTYSNVNGALSGNGSIGGGPSRPRIVCDPHLPRSERTFERQFRTECIAAPDDQYNFGTANGDEFHGPGFVNWDISAFKHIPLGGSRQLQLRVELYNAFNTKQWTTVDTAAQFDYTTRAQTNPAFGSLTGATTSARRIQLGARFTF